MPPPSNPPTSGMNRASRLSIVDGCPLGRHRRPHPTSPVILASSSGVRRLITTSHLPDVTANPYESDAPARRIPASSTTAPRRKSSPLQRPRRMPDGPRTPRSAPPHTQSLSPTASTAARTLDLGCAVGRFDLRALPILRRSHRHRLLPILHPAPPPPSPTRARCPTSRLDEGRISHPPVARLPAGHPGRQGILFETGDAMHLRADLGAFDRIHAANLLCRLTDPPTLARPPPRPRQARRRTRPRHPLHLARRVHSAGKLAGRHHPRLAEDHSLRRTFELIHTTDEPFLIRETARKFQWTASLLSVWRRL